MEYHHLKYKEIDGIDEFIPVTKHEHIIEGWKVHHGSRAPVPRNIQIKAKARVYNSKTKRIDFSTIFEPYTELHEAIRYNQLTGDVLYHSRFRSYHGKKLKIIEAKE